MDRQRFYWIMNHFAAGGGGIPFESDLLLNLSTRSGSSLMDAVSGTAQATVLTPVFVQSTAGTGIIYGDKTRSSELCLDGNDYTYHVKFRQMVDVPTDAVRELITFGGGTSAERRGIHIYSNYNRLRIAACDGTNIVTFDVTAVNAVNSTFSGAGVFDLYLKVDGTGKTITGGFYNSAGTLVGSAVSMDISSLTFNPDQNYQAITFRSKYWAFDNFKKFSGIKTLANCQDDTYSTGIQIHLARILSGIDISGNAQSFARTNVVAADILYTTIVNQSLDYGYTYYDYGDASYYFTIPKKYDGTATIPSRSVGALYAGSRIVGEYSADGICGPHDYKIRFTNDFFDRSSTTIWEDACRASSYYDAANTKDFHVSELNQRTLLSFLKADYRGRLYVHFNTNSVEKWDRDFIKNIYLYTTDHKGTEQANVLTYTGDVFAAIMSGGSYSLDGDGYVQLGTLKTTAPMVTLRFDDTRDTHFSAWYPALGAEGIYNVITGCHSNQMGETVGGVNFLSWANTLTMYNAGWEVCCHNREDDDYNTLAFVDSIETNFNLAISEQVAQGIPCNHYIGNKHSSENPSTAYIAHKVGFKSHVAWGISGNGGHYANPQALDKYQLCAVAVDIMVEDPEADFYYLDQDPYATELQNLKDQIDLCVSENRWLIIMIHDTATLTKVMTEVVPYVTTAGASFVNLTEGLANTAYL